MTFIDFCFVSFLRQGFSVALEPVLEPALVAQAGLDNRVPPASATPVMELKVCTTTALPYGIKTCKMSIIVHSTTEYAFGSVVVWLRIALIGSYV